MHNYRLTDLCNRYHLEVTIQKSRHLPAICNSYRDVSIDIYIQQRLFGYQ